MRPDDDRAEECRCVPRCTAPPHTQHRTLHHRRLQERNHRRTQHAGHCSFVQTQNDPLEPEEARAEVSGGHGGRTEQQQATPRCAATGAAFFAMFGKGTHPNFLCWRITRGCVG